VHALNEDIPALARQAMGEGVNYNAAVQTLHSLLLYSYYIHQIDARVARKKLENNQNEDYKRTDVHTNIIFHL
jgi:hypothetical protein